MDKNEDQYTFLITSRSVILRMRNFFEIKVLDKIKTYVLCSIIFFPRKSGSYEIVWKNVQLETPQMTIWRMRTACWIHTATNTFSE
jgi:hypothetical protein